MQDGQGIGFVVVSDGVTKGTHGGNDICLACIAFACCVLLFDFNPMMKTTYFTKQYGGLEITYWTHAKNFNRWQEIDRQIWRANCLRPWAQSVA